MKYKLEKLEQSDGAFPGRSSSSSSSNSYCSVLNGKRHGIKSEMTYHSWFYGN